MDSFEALAHGSRRLVWPVGSVFLFLGCLSVASPSQSRKLICWQAIMNCQTEPECHYAYGQYMHACATVLSGERKKCPSHCISSLVQLNLTKNGPALEDCSCASDAICRNTKRAIEPCLPRTSNMGCTEARRQCDRDQQCSSAMRDYLIYCGKLFSGATCTNACRNVIANMRKIPKAELLDTCVCDGTERTICEYVKVSMKNLCFEAPVLVEDGSGSEDYEEDDEDFPVPDPEFVGRSTGSGGSAVGSCGVVTVVTASVLVLLASLL